MRTMSIKKVALGWLLVLISANLAFAGLVPLKDARLIARNLYFERVQAFKPMKMSMIEITEEFTVGMAGEPTYYVFNIGNNEGFVLVAADDLVYPVLGYAFTGRYAPNNHHPAFAAQMQLYELQILYARETDPLVIPEIAEVWDKYRREQFTPAKDIQTVGPICKTTWDQGGFYNDSCPGNSVTGCVATAMAQVMKAFNWPPKGKGSYSYTHPSYGLQSANFGITSYNWSAMPNAVSAPNPSVAQLMYHCGVSVDMSYSPGGSGASMFRAKDALYMYFRYSPFIRTAQKSAYTDIYWKILIRAQHMNGRPVMYSGPGHAFICDGFQYPDHFHFNWGWGGSYDGYYYMTSLVPGGNNFTNGQDAIIDAYPDSTTKFDVFGEGGMRYISEGEQVQINPNPSADGMVNLVLLNGYTGEVQISVTDIKGSLKDRFTLSKQSEWTTERLNLAHLGSGFYLVILRMGNQSAVCKLLIQ